ncbi:hypothetical protein B0I35DRAFT_226109 [Stachybotrys elegans]|uniref:Uncharacterized protein n=1 Tax=Stachybotrys elegans TaxID=80388 RepID=A0A8K0SY02_9HYPO|nr:hypothetical protein B0I35DRAFT_226109 [Stachybotrys elegans]
MMVAPAKPKPPCASAFSQLNLRTSSSPFSPSTSPAGAKVRVRVGCHPWLEPHDCRHDQTRRSACDEHTLALQTLCSIAGQKRLQSCVAFMWCIYMTKLGAVLLAIAAPHTSSHHHGLGQRS